MILPALSKVGRKKSEDKAATPKKGPIASAIALAKAVVQDPSLGPELASSPAAVMVLQGSIGAQGVLDLIMTGKLPGDVTGDEEREEDTGADKADEKQQEQAKKDRDEATKGTEGGADGADDTSAEPDADDAPDEAEVEAGVEDKEGQEGSGDGAEMPGGAVGAAAQEVLQKLKDKKRKKAPKKPRGKTSKGSSPPPQSSGDETVAVDPANKAKGGDGKVPDGKSADPKGGEEPPPGADAGPESAEELDKEGGDDKDAKEIEDGAKKAGGGSGGPKISGGKKGGGGSAKSGGGGKASVGGGVGGGDSESVPVAPAPEPIAEPATDTGPGGTLDGYMKANPDMKHADQLEQIGFSGDTVARDERTLASNIPKPPEKGSLDALLRGDWANAQKALTGNRWRGQDKVMAFTTDLNTIISFVSGLAGKIGIVATVSGAILSFFMPPLGAFLLVVGRVANAVSLVCAGLKGVISMVQMIYSAIKAAKEKDPAKRMEYLQGAKNAVQGLVMAGLEVVMSKLGGKAKVGGSRVGSAMKAGWKEAGLKGALKSGGKEILKAGKDGFMAVGKGIKGGLKNVGKLAGSGLNAVRQHGLKSAVGMGLKKGASVAWKGAKTKFYKPLKDAAGGFGDLKGQFTNFKQLKTQHGHWGAVKRYNFPNLAKNTGGWKDQLKAAGKDLNKGGGGIGTHINVNLKGGAGKPEEVKPGDDPALHSDDVTKRTVAAESKKVADMDAALASGDGDQMRTQLDPQGKGTHAHYSDDDLKVMLSQQRKSTLDGQGLLTPSGGTGALNLASTALKTGQAALNKDGGAMSAMLTGVGSMGTLGGAVSKGMGLTTEAKTHALLYPKTLADAAAKNSARWAKLPIEMQKKATAERAAAGAVQASLGGAVKGIADHEQYLKGAAEACKDGGGGGGGGGGGVVVAGIGGGGASESEAPPPAPEEGALVPTDISSYIAAEEQRLNAPETGLRARIVVHKQAAEQGKVDSLAQLSDIAQLKLKLGKHKESAKKQSSDAKKDVGDIGKAKADIEGGQAGVTGAKGKAEGAQNDAEAKSNEGKAVNTKPDEAAKRKKEEARARDKEQDWKDEYNSAGRIKRMYMKGKKWLFSFTKLLAAAAKWIWKKLIAPAIKAVKAAMAKVMGFITDLIFSGVMKIVSLFLSEEDKKNLNETMDKMKKAEQAAQQAQDLESTQAKAEVKLDKTDKKAKAEHDRNDTNVKSADALIANIDANLSSLTGLKAQNDNERGAFKSAYAPYFDWVARRKEGGDEGADAGASAAVVAGATVGAEQDQADGGDAPENPAEEPMPAAVGEGLITAADILKAQSDKGHAEVTTASTGYRDTLRTKAGDVFDESARDFKGKALTYLQKRFGMNIVTTTVASYTDEEYRKCEFISGNADKVHEKVVNEHRVTEEGRKARLDAIKGEAGGLSGLKGMDSISVAKALVKKLERENVEADKQAAMDAMLTAYSSASKLSA